MMKSTRSTFAMLGAAAAFALAYRKSGRRQSTGLAALKPQGTRSAERSRHATGTGNVTTKAEAADRGRYATVPEEIPPRGWWEIVKRTVVKFAEHELMSEAASVTFFALLSLVPAVTAIVSIYGLFTDPSTIQSHLDSVSGFIPSGGMEIVKDQVKRLTESPATGLTLGAGFGILIALWSANQGSKAMLSALNDVYGERESRGFIKLTAISLAFTLGGIVTLLAGLGLILVLPLVFKVLGLAGAFDLAMKIARWPVVLLGIISALAVLYRYGPSRHMAKWRWVTWGGVIAAISWIALSYGFSWYVEHFGSYNKTYGSLGAIIGFMTWIWLSSTVLLLGAQLNAEMETQTVHDTTDCAAPPLGARKAAAADHVSST